MQENLEYIKQAFDYKSQGCYKQAIEMLYKALEEENENIEILFQLGELYFLLKNFARAEQYLEKVLAKNQNHKEALKLLEQIYLYSNNVSDAMLMAEKLYKIQESEENLLDLISVLSKNGNLKRIKDFEESDNDKILYAVSKAYYDNKLPEDAEEKLKKVLDINPENSDALVLLGKIYFDKSEFEKSKEIFNSFDKNVDNPEILNYLGLFALEDMKFVDAIKYFSKASNADKKNPKYYYNLGNAYFYNGWIKEATASYLQAIRLNPDNFDYRYSLAYLYYETKNFEKAQNEIDYILECDENHIQAHVLNALLKFQRKDYLGAKSELETNLRNGSDDNFTLISLAKVYSELQMYDKSEFLLKKVIDRIPFSLNYKCKLAEVYIAEKKYDEALNIVNEIIKNDENYITAYITGAKASFENDDKDEAKRYAQEAISLDMNYPEGYFWLAKVRLFEKDYDEALECMKRAIMADVDNALYYAEMSKIYEAKDDYNSALEYMQEAESITETTEYKLECKRLLGLKKNAYTELNH